MERGDGWGGRGAIWNLKKNIPEIKTQGRETEKGVQL